VILTRGRKNMLLLIKEMTLLKRLIALIFLERKFAGNLYNAQKASSYSQFLGFQEEPAFICAKNPSFHIMNIIFLFTFYLFFLQSYFT